ncbi:alpha-aminoadipic semialdehyde synthase, mitochondrial-like isoform X2 [Haliotis rufescens]|uniref:alpha-aminoadipic semialdehyde synthase, mitochondrial-like isoform X1 n=1 Tax=Haliotis rufescens TaxID=6454 RepID=UPI00201E80BB|nr:alpha-aminoadipic semialdehyde synthase, mitochondrial-like isoform X1 [Haliotis rufescens]XP_048252906.1 alpha-aminoadipic semialdehyde synthase, mitochondrial-like isoform X2 [Haliotis rufescens]
MTAQRRVLVLGAGRVSGPVYEDLAEEKDVHVTAVSVLKSELERAVQFCPGVRLECVDIAQDAEGRDRLIAEHDVVVSLVPYSLLPDVARACLSLRKHLVTTSYVDDEVKNLHQKASEAGLTFLCEMGLDPGIDHMLAMRTFDDIKQRGGRVTSYELWCGGLPAPECADNPLKYKFSWYPRGSLYACCRGGGYLKDRQVADIPEGPSLVESVQDLDFTPEFKVEGFPNMYNPAYLTLYGIQTVDNFLRGTLRYKGFSARVLGLMKLGLFSVSPFGLLQAGSRGVTWRKFICNELGLSDDVTTEHLESKVKDKAVGQEELEVIKRLGLLESEEIEAKGTPLDTLANYLEKRPEFMFGPDERDLVLMHIEVSGSFPDGSREDRKLDMAVFGDVGRHSAMAKTVGHVVASGAMLLLNGEITERGIVLPVSRSIYKPLLSDLEKKGVSFTDRKA